MMRQGHHVEVALAFFYSVVFFLVGIEYARRREAIFLAPRAVRSERHGTP